MGQSYASSSATKQTTGSPASIEPSKSRQSTMGNAAVQESLKAKKKPSSRELVGLDAMIENRIFEPGTVQHTRPEDADGAIEEVLGKYLKGEAKGKAIAGKVAVVPQDVFKMAVDNEHGPIPEGYSIDDIKGFEGDDRYWIHGDRGDRGTMIHEALHARAHPALGNESTPLNEGVTEYFTRKVCAAKGFRGRDAYPDEWQAACALVKVVGEDAVAGALFDGKLDAVVATMDARKPGSWTSFLDTLAAKVAAKRAEAGRRSRDP